MNPENSNNDSIQSGLMAAISNNSLNDNARTAIGSSKRNNNNNSNIATAATSTLRTEGMETEGVKVHNENSFSNEKEADTERTVRAGNQDTNNGEPTANIVINAVILTR
jgi:hypothetical protein